MRRVTLTDEIARTRPDVDDATGAILAGRVRVDGSVVFNPKSLVRPGCSIVVEQDTELRGAAKLRAALDAFGIEVDGRICLDVGASAGGFTTVLLERGALRVYAVDAGHGQLLGSLRQDARVVNLEATNVAELSTDLVGDPIDLVSIDVSYLPLRTAVAQLDRIELAPGCQLIGLVKPMFELGLATAPTDRGSVDAASDAARCGIESAGWRITATAVSPVRGAKGAIEGWIAAWWG